MGIENITKTVAQYFNKLNAREKAIVVLGLAGAIVIIVYGSVISPYAERYTSLNRMITQKETQYNDILKLRSDYFFLKKEYKELEKGASKAKEGFSPLTFMEGVSTQAKIKDKIISMKPSIIPMGDDYRESSIEIKMERVVLEHIMRYLHIIEGSEYPLKIKNLHVKSRFDDPGLMDASVTVSFFEKVK
jgi:general secretion pathway protein M